MMIALGIVLPFELIAPRISALWAIGMVVIYATHGKLKLFPRHLLAMVILSAIAVLAITFLLWIVDQFNPKEIVPALITTLPITGFLSVNGTVFWGFRKNVE